MKKQIILLVSLALFLVCLNGIDAMTLYCGDGYCDSAYYESDPLSEFYCPVDCGARVNETWCDETYPRDCPDTTCPDCPTCGTCSACTISKLPTSDLTSWCTSNGYSSSQASTPVTKKNNFAWIFWLILLIIGFVLGYYYRENKKDKRKRR
jgi:hypothetical protein